MVKGKMTCVAGDSVSFVLDRYEIVDGSFCVVADEVSP